MRIYVGNLAHEVTDTELSEAFAAHGTVASAKVIVDRDSGQSRGFGFVEIEDKAAAEAAIGALNGQDFHGRSLAVNEARERTDRAGNRGGESRRW